MTRTSDADLVALARAGDKEAFGQLVERHQQMVKHIALSFEEQMRAHEKLTKTELEALGEKSHQELVDFVLGAER